MTTGPGGHGDQAIRPFLDGFFGEEIIDDVVEYQAAIAVDGFVHVHPRAQGGDHDRHLVLHAHFQIVFQAVVGLVHDLVHRKRCRRLIRVGLVPGVQLFGDAL